jgi:nicotinate-nucleotide pyrophosphorylase (carboxylating)
MTDWNALSLPDLFNTLARKDAEDVVERALREDLGASACASLDRSLGDITSVATIAEDVHGRAVFASRSAGVIAGLRVVEIVAKRAGLSVEIARDDGTHVVAGDVIATVGGSLRTLLAHERTMLNFLTFLSGNATMTAQFTAMVRGTRASICDTRKTIPGMRTLQKYATRCGGGMLHRIGLFDAVLLKDNHLGSFGGDDLALRVRTAAQRARALQPISFVECEVDSLEQYAQVLTLERGIVDMVLLDNMTPTLLAKAVAMRDQRAPWILLEASGGVRLETVRAIAESGVDRISIGAMTHSAPALDVGLDLVSDCFAIDASETRQRGMHDRAQGT